MHMHGCEEDCQLDLMTAYCNCSLNRIHHQ